MTRSANILKLKKRILHFYELVKTRLEILLLKIRKFIKRKKVNVMVTLKY